MVLNLLNPAVCVDNAIMLRRMLISITKSTKQLCSASCAEDVWHCAHCAVPTVPAGRQVLKQSLSTRITDVSIALCLPPCLP